MVKIEIRPEEVQALDVLLNEVKCSVKVGMVLGIFRTRIQEEFNKEQEKQMKEKLNGKGKGKTE